MSVPQKCPHCGFVGYPEVARQESMGKNFIIFFLEFFSRNRYRLPEMIIQLLFSSYEGWDKFSTKKTLRCARCKKPLAIEEENFLNIDTYKD